MPSAKQPNRTLCPIALYAAPRWAPSRASRGRRPPRQRRPAMEAKLLEATERLLSDGTAYTELSIQQLCSEAGIARSTFYVYFRDKADLVARLAEEMVGQLSEAASTWWQPGASREELLASTRRVIEIYAAHSALFAALTETAAYDADMRAMQVAIVERNAAAARRPDRRRQARRQRPRRPHRGDRLGARLDAAGLLLQPRARRRRRGDRPARRGADRDHLALDLPGPERRRADGHRRRPPRRPRQAPPRADARRGPAPRLPGPEGVRLRHPHGERGGQAPAAAARRQRLRPRPHLEGPPRRPRAAARELLQVRADLRDADHARPQRLHDRARGEPLHARLRARELRLAPRPLRRPDHAARRRPADHRRRLPRHLAGDHDALVPPRADRRLGRDDGRPRRRPPPTGWSRARRSTSSTGRGSWRCGSRCRRCSASTPTRPAPARRRRTSRRASPSTAPSSSPSCWSAPAPPTRSCCARGRRSRRRSARRSPPAAARARTAATCSARCWRRPTRRAPG